MKAPEFWSLLVVLENFGLSLWYLKPLVWGMNSTTAETVQLHLARGEHADSSYLPGFVAQNQWLSRAFIVLRAAGSDPLQH